MDSRALTASKSFSSEIDGLACAISPLSSLIVSGALPRGRWPLASSVTEAICSGANVEAMGTVGVEPITDPVSGTPAPPAGATPVARSIAAAAVAGEKPALGAVAVATPIGSSGAVGVTVWALRT